MLKRLISLYLGLAVRGPRRLWLNKAAPLLAAVAQDRLAEERLLESCRELTESGIPEEKVASLIEGHDRALRRIDSRFEELRSDAYNMGVSRLDFVLAAWSESL